ncbi:hypothetical protein ANOM_003662, partial [Aspergillus nomiae NRRL 13137]
LRAALPPGLPPLPPDRPLLPRPSSPSLTRLLLTRSRLPSRPILTLLPRLLLSSRAPGLVCSARWPLPLLVSQSAPPSATPSVVSSAAVPAPPPRPNRPLPPRPSPWTLACGRATPPTAPMATLPARRTFATSASAWTRTRATSAFADGTWTSLKLARPLLSPTKVNVLCFALGNILRTGILDLNRFSLRT